MPLVPLQLPPGIVRGATPYDSPDRWYDSNLVRWNGGIVQPVGGWQRLSATAFTNQVRKIHCWRSSASQRFILLGTTDKVFTDESGTWVDVTPDGMQPLGSLGAYGYGVGDYGEEAYGTARTNPSVLYTSFAFYTFSNWGEDVIFTNSSDGKMYYYDVSNPTNDAVQIGKHNISSISRTSNVTTVTTSTPHNLSVGESITIAGVADTSFNTNAVVLAVSSSTVFTYNNTGSNGSSSGGTVTDNTVPVGVRAVIVSEERHVFAIGISSFPRRLAWSSREDPTDWNFASPTNTAGYIDIESTTPLLTAVSVREGILLFSESEAFLVRFIGNPFLYSVERLGETSILNPNMVSVFDGKAMWFDQSGFMVYEGGSMRPVPCPVLDFFKSDFDASYSTAVAHSSPNGVFDELWFFYPSSGQTECDKYIIFNYNDGWWGKGSLSRTAMFPAGANQTPLAAGTDKQIYSHENGWTDAGDSRVGTVFIETGSISLGEGDRGWEIRQMLPATGFGYDSLKTTFFTRQTPNGSERTFGPYYARSDGYTDTRVSGRDARLRFEATEDGDWNIGKMRLEVAPGAGR